MAMSRRQALMGPWSTKSPSSTEHIFQAHQGLRMRRPKDRKRYSIYMRWTQQAKADTGMPSMTFSHIDVLLSPTTEPVFARGQPFRSVCRYSSVLALWTARFAQQAHLQARHIVLTAPCHR